MIHIRTLFGAEAHSKMLKDRYPLIHYAALILAGRTENNLLLRIPPEVMPTVEDIVEKVREKQLFYAKRDPE